MGHYVSSRSLASCDRHSFLSLIRELLVGRFGVDREFVNIENSHQDCAQDHQEDPQGTSLGQDGAQDR